MVIILSISSHRKLNELNLLLSGVIKVMYPFICRDSSLRIKSYACSLTEEYVPQQVLHAKPKTYDPIVHMSGKDNFSIVVAKERMKR